MLMDGWLFDICSRCLVQLSSQEHCFDTSYRQCFETHYLRHLTILYQEHKDSLWVTGWCDSSKKRLRHTDKWKEHLQGTHYFSKTHIFIPANATFPRNSNDCCCPLCDSIFRHVSFGIHMILELSLIFHFYNGFYMFSTNNKTLLR